MPRGHSWERDHQSLCGSYRTVVQWLESCSRPLTSLAACSPFSSLYVDFPGMFRLCHSAALTLQWFPIALRVKMKVLGMACKASLVLIFACLSSFT